ncbi:MAG: IS110 family RNA-guided transposase [Mycobacteriales bacterium]
MTRMAEQPPPVTGGVDTHADAHVAGVVDCVGRVLGTRSFRASLAGYRLLLAWLRSFGELTVVGVEGTGSYGAGLARYLAAEGVAVVEVIRPNRQNRRRRGKSDTIDAVAAALAALSGDASGTPKSHDGAAESIRVLKVARRGAIKARTQAGNQLRDLIVTAPGALRTRLAGLSTEDRVEAAARLRPGDFLLPVEATKLAMAAIARRHQEFTAEIDRLDAALAVLVEIAAPEEFLAKQGVGPQGAATLLATVGDNPDRLASDASFAALAGASPVDASSGKQARHRLNRGGDRAAHSALWRIAFTRWHHDQRTKDYVARRRAEGKTDKEIMRCLIRYIAREVFKALVVHRDGTGASDAAEQTAA